MDRSGSKHLTPAVSELRRLVNHGRDLANRLQAAGDPYDQAVIAAILSRATSTAEATVVLAEHGFGQQAVIFNRVLYELMVDAHWAHANRALARERFVQHARFKLHLQRGAASQYSDAFPGIDEAETLADDEVRELRRIFGRYGHKSWTGLQLRDRVSAIEEQFPEGEARRNLWFFQDLLNDLSNAEIHPSSWSLGRLLRRAARGDGTEMIQVRNEPEPELAPDALYRAWWSYGELLEVVVREFDLPRAELEQLAERGVTIFRELDATPAEATGA